ncbi:hypothetical protein Tco_1088505 [Tanacetum coccineum]
MLAKQNDPISKEKKINISPIDYNKLNKLAKDFRKRFVPQMQLFAEQAFWLSLLNPKSEQLDIIKKLVEIEVPKELPKVNLVKTIGIKRLLDDLEVTAAKVRVTTAKQNLVLFSNLNEKYAKVNGASTKVTTAGRVYADREEIKDLLEKE